MNMDSLIISTAFYDVMFPESCTEFSQLETKIIKRINATLSSRELLSSDLQPLPSLQLELLNLLGNDKVHYRQVADLIQKDPALTLKVLKVVDSAKNSSGFEISNLSTAVARLGVNGIANIASAIMMKSINPPKPIYYKLYGKQIWSHSLQSAFLCKEFSKSLGEEEFLGHFLGLIHDVGKILIFECLVDTMTTSSFDHEIGSEQFRREITVKSLDVSYFVAREWCLPDVLCDALQQQRTGINSSLALALCAANECSEFQMTNNSPSNCAKDLPLIIQKTPSFVKSWEQFLAECDTLALGV